MNRRTVADIAAIADEDRTDARLVQPAHAAIHDVQTHDGGLVEARQRRVSVERAPAEVPPGAAHRRQAADGVHVDRAVATAGEAVLRADESARRGRVEPREADDVLGVEAGDSRGPLRRARLEMLLGVGVEVGVPGEEIPVGEILLEHHVNHGAGKRAVIEHTSINPNASPHVGRARNAMRAPRRFRATA